MAAITAALIKQVREDTGTGMLNTDVASYVERSCLV